VDEDAKEENIGQVDFAMLAILVRLGLMFMVLCVVLHVLQSQFRGEPVHI
jgi:hypothetical protein